MGRGEESEERDERDEEVFDEIVEEMMGGVSWAMLGRRLIKNIRTLNPIQAVSFLMRCGESLQIFLSLSYRMRA